MGKERESIRNKRILCGMLVIVLCAVIYTSVQGKEQDKTWVKDYQIFRQAESIAGERNYDQAVNLFSGLLNKKYVSDSVTINWELAKTLKLKGDYITSQKHYLKVKEAYPAVVMEEDFLKEYGEVLLAVKNYPEAEKYLQQIMRITESDNTRRQAADAIELIKKQKVQ